MAAQTNGHPAVHNPTEVGNAFIEQYYTMLLRCPDDAHRFYREGSEMSRPGPNGDATSATTMQGISELILSQNYGKYKAEITTSDAQASYEGGVSVLVTGVLTGEDSVRRTFTQSFFLAPQEAGFYVLNDMFRYVDGISSGSVSLPPSDDVIETTEAPVTPEPEVSEPAENEPLKEELSNGKEDTVPVENGKDRLSVEETVVESPADSGASDVSHPATVSPSAVQGDGAKKSFASIVNALKSNSAPFQVRASPNKVVEKPRAPAVAPDTPVQSVPNGTPAEKTTTTGQTVKRPCIFVGNLPLDATPAQLEATFKKFGPIKPKGIQVRSSGSKGSCYGFVEFESETSVQAALEETSILIGNRTAHIEELKNGSGEKGQAPQGRGGFRNDNYRGNDSFRGRGNFSGGRGYGRSDFEKKSEFSYRNGRNGGGGSFNREYQNGSGRVPRQVVKE